MQFDLVLNGFRSFGERQVIPIRPITILLGENSSGKSSILAALQYLIDWIGGFREPSFKRSPFDLGDKSNIAHFRGGQSGRRSEFEIGMVFEATTGRRKKRPIVDGKYAISLTFYRDSEGMLPDKIFISRNEQSVELFASDRGELNIKLNDELIEMPEQARARGVPFFFFAVSGKRLRDIEYFLGVERKSISKNSDDSRVKVFNVIDSFFASAAELAVTRVAASGPVRSRPLRTYDSNYASIDDPSGQSMFRMANIWRRNETQRDTIKHYFIEYAKDAGLFRDINVKNLGKSASDLFQIQVNASGRPMNIVDVGYGVSQILPILYFLSHPNSRSIYMLQQPEVHLHPRAQAALGTLISKTASEYNYIIIETHSDYIVDRIRYNVREGAVLHDSVALNFCSIKRFSTNVSRIGISSKGAIIDPPDEYREFFLEESIRMLGV